MEQKIIKTITRITQDLLNRLQTQATVTVDQEEETFNVRLETEDAGVLIGYRGRSLQSLQTVLGQLIAKELGEWKRIVLHVGDYRERREEYLNELASSVAQEVIETGADVAIPDLSSYERRLVHMVLAEHPEVISESEGMGKNRRLIVKKRAS